MIQFRVKVKIVVALKHHKITGIPWHMQKIIFNMLFFRTEKNMYITYQGIR